MSGTHRKFKLGKRSTIIHETDRYAMCIDGTRCDTSRFDIKNIEYSIKMLYYSRKKKTDATVVCLHVNRRFLLEH
jgi:hypothetical protein